MSSSSKKKKKQFFRYIYYDCNRRLQTDIGRRRPPKYIIRLIVLITIFFPPVVYFSFFSASGRRREPVWNIFFRRFVRVASNNILRYLQIPFSLIVNTYIMCHSVLRFLFRLLYTRRRYYFYIDICSMRLYVYTSILYRHPIFRLLRKRPRREIFRRRCV